MSAVEPVACDVTRERSAPPREPLYVAGDGRWSIAVRYGAIELEHPLRPTRRFPLSRVDRIVCGAALEWRRGALTECLASGLTTLFVGKHGLTVGYALPAVEAEEPLHACLMHLARLPHAAHRLDDWWRHRRMHLVRDWWKHCRRRSGFPESYLEEVIRLYVYHGEVPVRLPDERRASAESFALSRLRRHGALPVYDALHGAKIRLLQDLVVLLWGRVNLDPGILGVATASTGVQVAFLEAELAALGPFLEGEIAELERFVAEQLRPWQ